MDPTRRSESDWQGLLNEVRLWRPLQRIIIITIALLRLCSISCRCACLQISCFGLQSGAADEFTVWFR